MKFFRPAALLSGLPTEFVDSSSLGHQSLERPVFAPSSVKPFCWTWLSLSGPDAQNFLHRLSTVDVKNLAVGTGKAGCFLTPQGKIRAGFSLWRDAADRFSFEFDPGHDQTWKSQALTFIDQYTFGEKMTVVDESLDHECLWLFPSSEQELSALGISLVQEGQTFQVPAEAGLQLRVRVHSTTEFGRTWLTIWGLKNSSFEWVHSKFPGLAEVSPAEIDLWRIHQLRPRASYELTGDESPLEIGLRNAIADQKGCYPGQEVIEKVISIGSPARRLVRIEVLGRAPNLGDLILSHDSKTEIGKVTSVAHELSDPIKNLFQVLGLVKKTFAKSGELVRFSSSQETTGAMMQIAPYE